MIMFTDSSLSPGRCLHHALVQPCNGTLAFAGRPSLPSQTRSSIREQVDTGEV